MKRYSTFTIILFIILLIFYSNVQARDRCQDYIQDIRQYSVQYLGYQYPYWYSVGCMIAESNCRADILSFDGGIGLFQLTPRVGVVAEISKYIPVDPYNAQSSIRAYSFYISRIKDVKLKQEQITFRKYKIRPASFTRYCGTNLADIYKFYNGGYWFVYESSRKKTGTYVCENREMFKYCVRGGTYTDKNHTKWLSFCEVNYSYPEKIYKYAQPYKKGMKDGIQYWYTDQPKPKPKQKESDIHNIFNYIFPIK